MAADEAPIAYIEVRFGPRDFVISKHMPTIDGVGITKLLDMQSIQQLGQLVTCETVQGVIDRLLLLGLPMPLRVRGTNPPYTVLEFTAATAKSTLKYPILLIYHDM